MNIAGLLFMNHPLSPRFISLYYSIVFLSNIDATPHDHKCNTIDATPVRWLG